MKRVFAVCLGVGLLACAGYAGSPAALKLHVSNGSARLVIIGEVGSACTIQWTDDLNDTYNWQVLTNLAPLFRSPYPIVDDKASSVRRFYRVVAQPMPTSARSAG